MNKPEVPPETAQPHPYTKRDFVSDQTVRWCPGCGDYAILDAVQKVFATLQVPKENYVIVSGIGCSSRFPYYMNTYGFHTIHGRAPAVATGLKIARPELSVWVVTGDGDALSIGGNHILHAMRRNVDIKVLLFNNKVYGLTKGQYSPTSEPGMKSKTSPFGSVDRPVRPVSVALAAEATFVARSLDVYGDHLREILTRAAAHQGSAFIEILQNCPIFNDGAFGAASNRKLRDDNIVKLEHGQPLVFGKHHDKGIRLNGFDPEVVSLDEGDVKTGDLLHHNESDTNPSLAHALAQLSPPDFPTPLGVFRALEAESYERAVHRQIAASRSEPMATLDELLHQGDTWKVSTKGD